MLRLAAGPRLHSPQQTVSLRSIVEAVLLLAIAVAMFRVFCAESYMISTGSMAPSLLGYHRRVTCPNCQLTFERGAAFDPSVSGQVQASGDATLTGWDAPSMNCADCPICGTPVELTDIPRTEGDQLLVHKNHYALRDPHRWEVVVFRNPAQPSQAYVKRVVGLPGETVEIRDGDVYVDGVMQRKPLASQLATRILVDDVNHRPSGEVDDWQPRWVAASSASHWVRGEGRFASRAPEKSLPPVYDPELDWLVYRHWIASGGQHRTDVSLDVWPADWPRPRVATDGFVFDEERCQLRATGAVSKQQIERWNSRAAEAPREDRQVRAAVRALRTLYQESHTPLLSDVCSYNRDQDDATQFPIHELMVSCRLEPREVRGLFAVSLHDGDHEFLCVIDLAAGEAWLVADEKPAVLRFAKCPAPFEAGRPVEIICSIFDRQVLLAVDGALVFEPLRYAHAGPRSPLPKHPVRLGAAGADFDLFDVRLDRDIYYTPPEKGGGARCRLGADEFFVLGDNSPVSLDSREWENPAVPRSMLIGRPFLVHLPSRQARVPWDASQTVRIPDPYRIRYIH